MVYGYLHFRELFVILKVNNTLRSLHYPFFLSLKMAFNSSKYHLQLWSNLFEAKPQSCQGACYWSSCICLFGTSVAFVLHFVIRCRYYEILESNPIADAKYQYLWCRVLGPCSCYWLLVFMYDFLTLGKTKFCQAGLVLHGEGCYFWRY